jgi:polysaccharide biosynthesis transport protein
MNTVSDKLLADTQPAAGRLGGAPMAAIYDRLDAVRIKAFEAAPPANFDLREYWRTVKKRKWLIGGVTVSFVLIGLLWTLMATPYYTSVVRIQIDRDVAKVVEGGGVIPGEGLNDAEFLKTQYELLQSRSLAERVASLTHLADDTEFNKQARYSVLNVFRGAGNTVSQRAEREHSAALTVLARRVVRPIAGSRLVDVSYSDPSPERAQRIAAAYGEAFIAFNLDKRFQANSYAKTFLEDKIKQLKLRLEGSEKALLKFAKKEQIVSTTDKTSIAESNLASANAALATIIAERIKNEQLWKQVQDANAIDFPQLLSSKLIDELRARRNQILVDYQEKSGTFQPRYPEMVQINNKIKEIDRQLAAEIKTIKNSLKAAYEASLSQEYEMKERIETLRADVLDLQQRSIQYNILKREVDTTRSLYEGLLQRFKEVDVASGVGANNVFIVDRAELSHLPSSPVISKALVLSLALGLLAGLGAAHVAEHFDDIIYTPEDAETITGLPLLGVIPKVDHSLSIQAELENSRSPLSEAYRSMCTLLQFSTVTGLPRTLLVTSGAPSEGKSITAALLARHFATMGLKVLLIDGDLRNPSLHKTMELDNSIGFSNYLTGNCEASAAIQRTKLDNLLFIASGPLPPHAPDLLGSSELPSLLSGFQRGKSSKISHGPRGSVGSVDFIIIDGPPVAGMADALILSNVAAATVLVISAGESRKGIIRNTLKRLEQVRSSVVGTVVTKYDATADSYYRYEYGYNQKKRDERGNGLEHSPGRHALTGDWLRRVSELTCGFRARSSVLRRGR